MKRNKSGSLNIMSNYLIRLIIIDTLIFVLNGCTSTNPPVYSTNEYNDYSVFESDTDSAACCIQACQPKKRFCPAGRPRNTSDVELPSSEHAGRNGPLTPQEMAMALIAWKYFENNYQETTGLVNAVNDYPSTTMWDTGSYLAALVAAYELCIIDKNTFDKRLIKILRTLNTLEFFSNGLPNKVYHTVTAQKVDYANQPGEIGVSGLDLGRLLIWLKIIKERYPEHSNAIDKFVLRWNFCQAIDEQGTIFGAYIDPNTKQVILAQEGRLGYEEYAAKGFNLWGFDTTKASKPEPYNIVKIYDEKVPYDTRDPRELQAHNYVVSESYVLDALELNWDEALDQDPDDTYHSHPWMHDFAQRIYQTQVKRYEESGILTARTEHQLDKAPYFVYDTIYTDGYPWNTITEDGKYVPEYAAIALKGALGLWAVWDTAYTDLLFNAVADLYDPEKGFYEGRYENGNGVIEQFTANNNGIMLETLLYKVQGKLLRFSGRPSLWDSIVADEFKGNERCLPGKPRKCLTDT